jgi:hypothetical protein
MQAASKPAEERHLGRVPDRIAGRKDSKRQVEPENRRQRDQRLLRNACGSAELDPADLAVRDADRGADLPLREASPDSCGPELLANELEKLSREAPAAIPPMFAPDHENRMASERYPSLIDVLSAT